MKYVEWVEVALQAALEASFANDDARVIGASIEAIREQIGLDAGDGDFRSSPAGRALLGALDDLKKMGLVETDFLHVKVTQEGRKSRESSLRTAWPDIFRIFLDEEQQEFLAASVRICERRFADYATVEEVTAADVARELGWDDAGAGRLFDIAQRLTDLGCLQSRAYLGGRIDLYPRYVGVVRASEAEQTAWQALIDELLPEWETVTVEFKRSVQLGRDKEKAEFVRDILALATTKASGRRFYIIGFDAKSHLFAESVDVGIDQDRVEQILYAYAEPTPDLRYRTAVWDDGEIGIMEVFRDAAKIPYRIKKSLAHIRKGNVFVRHGSQVEPPTSAELEDLEAEGKAAALR